MGDGFAIVKGPAGYTWHRLHDGEDVRQVPEEELAARQEPGKALLHPLVEVVRGSCAVNSVEGELVSRPKDVREARLECARLNQMLEVQES